VKKIYAVIPCFLLWALTIYASEQNDNSENIAATVRLSREVKEFEKTLGLQPTDILSHSVADTNVKPTSLLYIWIQKYGTLATRKHIDLQIGLVFTDVKEKIPLNKLSSWSDEGYSVFFRHINEFADKTSVITSDLAQQPLSRQVEVFCHEDIHKNLPGVPEFDNEAVTSALGFLAALAYFDQKKDPENATIMSEKIIYTRKMSRELNDLVQLIESKVFSGAGTLESKRRIATRLVYATIAYGAMYGEQTTDQSGGEALEAKISHDFMYWKYFDDITGIYEKMRDLPKLIKELNAMPKNQLGGFPQYIETLKTKYGYSAK